MQEIELRPRRRSKKRQRHVYSYTCKCWSCRYTLMYLETVQDVTTKRILREYGTK